MSSTPRGLRLASPDDDGEREGDGFAGHSGLDTPPNFELTNSSVEQQRYGGFEQYGSQARSLGPPMSSGKYLDSTPDKYMPYRPSTDYGGGKYFLQDTNLGTTTDGAPSFYTSRTNGSFTCSMCAREFRRRADLNHHQRTAHLGARPYKCEVPDCQAGVTSWTWEDGLLAHNEQWHSSSLSRIPRTQAASGYYPSYDIPNQWSNSTSTTAFTGPSTTSAVPDLQPGMDRLSLQSNPNFKSSDSQPITSIATSRYIRSKDPNTTKEEFDPHYKVHKDVEFKWGRVFKVLWSEPPGTKASGSTIVSKTEEGRGKNGGMTFQKVRRFVIIQPMAGHCICLPILTYAAQGVMKKGVHANDHAPIYNKGGKAAYGPGEQKKGLTRQPIEVHCDPRHKMDQMSRLNYAKTYTVEYNVKVWFIGRIAKASEEALAANYNDVHPPLKAPTTSDAHLEPTSSSNEPRSTQPSYSEYSVTSGAYETATWSSHQYQSGYLSASTRSPDENAINRDEKDENLSLDNGLYDAN
ncbi:hypothetical protein IFR05_004350 [Cadophora sp. M221]|nr:hypothetical protein IFR05_004350 [Cadophora sp. M221]